MKRTSFIAIIAVMAGNALAQEARKAVVWSESETCGYKKNIDPATDPVKCLTINTEKGRVSVFEHSGLKLWIVLAFDDSKLLISTSLTNATDEPIAFDSDNWRAAHFESIEDFRNKKAPVFAESSIPSRDLLRGIRNGNARASSLDSYMANTHIVPKMVEVRKPDGTRTRVMVQGPNEEEQFLATTRFRNRDELTLEQQDAIRKNALTAKFVAANSTIKGLVYFRREKKAAYSMISMPIGDTTYILQFLHGEKK